jgi:hypothetical protein
MRHQQLTCGRIPGVCCPSGFRGRARTPCAPRAPANARDAGIFVASSGTHGVLALPSRAQCDLGNTPPGVPPIAEGTLVGVRPSSGAATSARSGGLDYSSASGWSGPAAPGDGRTPVLRRLCPPHSFLAAFFFDRFAFFAGSFILPPGVSLLTVGSHLAIAAFCSAYSGFFARLVHSSGSAELW